MRGSILKWFCVAYLISPLPGLSSAASGQNDLQVSLAGMEGLRLTRFGVFESRYPDTRCIELLSTRDARSLGFVCRSRSRQFVEDMGISPVEALPPSARPASMPSSGLVVATPMAQYNMETMVGVTANVAGAVVDCDLKGAEVYRATGTCHVAIRDASKPEVTYGNLVVEDHAGKRKGLTPNQILLIWNRLSSP